ncbi:MAG: glycosyltransferase [Psychroflexus halocasei]
MEFKSKYEVKPVIENKNLAPKNPLVSVCVQTYQHVNYIKSCLESILEQKTDFNFEILLGEDMSTDGTREICIEYAEKHPDKIRLFLHHRENNIKINGNPTGRFNFLYNLYTAKGKYIALCEGDDYWTDPLKLQKQVDFLEANPEIGASFTNAIIDNHINQITFEYNKPYKLEEGVLDNRIVFNKGGGVFPTCTFIFKAELAPSFFLKELAGDEMLLFTIANNSKIAFQDFISATYNRWNNGVFSSIINNSKKLIEFRKKEINGYKKLLHLLHDTNKVYLKTKMKKIALHVIRSNKYSISNLKYIRFVGVKTFIKIYLDDLR